MLRPSEAACEPKTGYQIYCEISTCFKEQERYLPLNKTIPNIAPNWECTRSCLIRSLGAILLPKAKESRQRMHARLEARPILATAIAPCRAVSTCSVARFITCKEEGKVKKTAVLAEPVSIATSDQSRGTSKAWSCMKFLALGCESTKPNQERGTEISTAVGMRLSEQASSEVLSNARPEYRS